MPRPATAVKFAKPFFASRAHIMCTSKEAYLPTEPFNTFVSSSSSSSSSSSVDAAHWQRLASDLGESFNSNSNVNCQSSLHTSHHDHALGSMQQPAINPMMTMIERYRPGLNPCAG